VRFPGTATPAMAEMVAQQKADADQEVLVLFRWRDDWIVDRYVEGVPLAADATIITPTVPDDDGFDAKADAARK
jgi:hypothetical protein